MKKRTRQHGLSIIDVIVVLGLIAALTFVASLEFPRFQQAETPPAVAE